MWINEELINIPKTKGHFMMSYDEYGPIFIKPGRIMQFSQKGWMNKKTIGWLDKKIERFAVSSSGMYSIHIPKEYPYIVVLKNSFASNSRVIPIPNLFTLSDGRLSIVESLIYADEKVQCANSFDRFPDTSSNLCIQNKITPEIISRISDFSVSDNGECICIFLEGIIWLWIENINIGPMKGAWINVSKHNDFSMASQTKESMVPLTFRSIGLFSNPDEGRGVCILSIVLPPSKPYDTIYLFNTYMTLDSKGIPHTNKYDLILPLTQGYNPPKVWWSPCARIIVIYITKCIVLLTRNLDVIRVLPLKDVFVDENTEVTSISWSKSFQYFVLASSTGLIGAVMRNGISLKHSICHIPPFNEEMQTPLFIGSNLNENNSFLFYNNYNSRILRLDSILFINTIENVFSFTLSGFGSALLNQSVSYLESTSNKASQHDIMKLLMNTEVFQVFRYESPLRHMIFSLVRQQSNKLYIEKQYTKLLFFVRCVFWITDLELPEYSLLLEKLQKSSFQRDRLLFRILYEEKNHKDWVQIIKPNNLVINVSEEYRYPSECIIDLKRPYNNRDVDAYQFSRFVKNILYQQDYDEFDQIKIDLNLIIDIMIELKKFDRVFYIAKHPSISTNPTDLYQRITLLYKDDAASQYRALNTCIKFNKEIEYSLRSICLKSLILILETMILDSSPSGPHPAEILLSKMCIIEESIDLPVPMSNEDLNDFAIVFGLALCTSKFKHISDFLNGKSKSIPSELRDLIRQLFRLLWFVRWRHLAYAELMNLHKPGDATLRLIKFPEFIDVQMTKRRIEIMGKSQFSSDIYDHYMNGNSEFEFDPDFVQFACECAIRLSSPLLQRISDFVLSDDRPENINESGLLISAIVSNMIPWLRVGIPCAIEKVEAALAVPNILLDFEELSFDTPHVEQIQSEKALSSIETDIETEEFSIVNMIENEEDKTSCNTKEKKEIFEMKSDISEGEIEINNKKTLSEKKKKDKNKRDKQKKDMSGTDEKKKKKKHEDKSKEKSYEKSKEDKKHKYKPPYEAPKLRFIQQEPNQLAYSPMPMFGMETRIPLAQYQPPLIGPIWDFDPNLFSKGTPKPVPNIPLVPTSSRIAYDNVQTQHVPVIPSTHVVTFSQDVYHKKNQLYESDTLSEFEPINNGKESNINNDPFPIDFELHRRVEDLINNPVQINIPVLRQVPKIEHK